MLLRHVLHRKQTSDLLQTAAFHRKLFSKGNGAGGSVCCIFVVLVVDLSNSREKRILKVRPGGRKVNIATGGKNEKNTNVSRKHAQVEASVVVFDFLLCRALPFSSDRK